jgi:predicted transcriptional regulator
MEKPIFPRIGSHNGVFFRAAVLEGIEAADAGKLSDFEPIADWLASWGSKDELPPPE